MKHDREKNPGCLPYVLGMFLTAALLVAVNLHPIWRPWLGGLVTKEWSQVMWAIDVSLGIQVVGNAMLTVARPAWARRLFDLVNSFTALVSVAVTYSVYPFDLGPFDIGLRLFLVVIMFALSIAVVVNAIRSLLAPMFPEDAAVPR